MTRRRKRGPSALFLIPSLAGVLIFVLIPFADVVRRSFASAVGGAFTGVRNYTLVLENAAFQLAAANTARFLLVSIPMLLALSLLLALILYPLRERAGLFKTAFLIPMAIPVASIALLWRVLFANHGLVNGAFAALGLLTVPWMEGKEAFWVLVGSFLWKNAGYDVVLWLAGLAAIPESQYEAARVDGAGRVRIFFSITLPGLLPCLYTILVLSLLNAFKVFREAYLVSGDYPRSESIYLLQHLFGNWFRELSMDKLAAAAVMTAAVILAVILLVQRLWEER